MARIDLGHIGRRPIAPVRAADGVHEADCASAAYEPPALEDLGTFVELTRGSNATSSDGLGPGSTL